ncbi:Rho GTPase-activating protein 18 [Nymphon striatum]|nr:Rho GTPase-activating protein 18 [Nymphon striatum]
MAEDTVQFRDKEVLEHSHYEDYWSEYHSITRTEIVTETQDVEDGGKSDDDLESEIEWFIETGFDFLVSYIKDGHEEPLDNDYEDVMSTLTTKQAAAVKKRIATLKGTVHQKSQRSPPDVRDVFSKPVRGFHCHIGKDNRTEITINTESNNQKYDAKIVNIPISVEKTFQDENKSSTSHQHDDSNGESRVIDENYLKISTAKKYDTKRNSIPEIIAFMSNHKQEYNVKDQQSPSAENNNLTESARQNFREKFTYNSELHPSAFSTVADKDDTSSTSQESDSDSFKIMGEINEEDLPDLVPKEDERGVTTVNDLSPNDMIKVRQLALIELTTLFDLYNISYSRRKANKKRHKGNIFGSSLSAIVYHDSKKDASCKVPKLIEMVNDLLISQIVNNGLEEKGILRVPGSFAKIETLRNKVETQYFTSPELIQKVILNSSARDCAALLKNFIRDLSEPVLTNSYLDAFLKVQNLPDIVLQVKALNLLILILPEIHRDFLCYIISFLDRIIYNVALNSMGLHNVAMIMAPNFFLPNHKKNGYQVPDEKTNLSNIEDEMHFARVSCKVTKLIIRYWELLWMVPPFLLQQVRTQNDAIRNKRANKDLKHRKKKHGGKFITQENDLKSAETTVTLIKVSTPIPKVGIFCPLNNDTLRAGDVVLAVINEIQANPQKSKLFNSKNRPRSMSDMQYDSSRPCLLTASDKTVFVENHYLCEVGGNIGYRRLHHDVNVSAVLRENPLAEWVVKCFHVQ